MDVSAPVLSVSATLVKALSLSVSLGVHDAQNKNKNPTKRKASSGPKIKCAAPDLRCQIRARRNPLNFTLSTQICGSENPGFRIFRSRDLTYI